LHDVLDSDAKWNEQMNPTALPGHAARVGGLPEDVLHQDEFRSGARHELMIRDLYVDDADVDQGQHPGIPGTKPDTPPSIPR
jgi:hypothetical protein